LPIARFSTAPRRGVKQVVTIGQIGAKLRLKITAGNAVGKEVTVDDELLLGREVPGEGRLEDDIELSRKHARIARRAEGEWVIEDLGSRNGTFVNGARIDEQVLLAAGDAIELGGTKLVVQVSAPTKPSEPAAEPDPPSAEPDAPSATVAGAAAPKPPPVSLRLDIDVATGEAAIALGDGSDQVKLVFEDGAWRLRPDA
jgi:predicted component of type VI protein secretion system